MINEVGHDDSVVKDELSGLMVKKIIWWEKIHLPYVENILSYVENILSPMWIRNTICHCLSLLTSGSGYIVVNILKYANAKEFRDILYY